MRGKRAVGVGLAVALGGLLATSPVSAALQEVFSLIGDRTVLNVTNDLVNWGGPNRTFLLSGHTFISTDGLEVKVFRQGSPILGDCEQPNGDFVNCDFQLREQPVSWTGNFKNGDQVLENIQFTPFDDAIHIQFSQPVLGAGTQLQLVAQAPFTGVATAYETPFIDGPGGDPADDAFLGQFTVEGESCDSNAPGAELTCPQGSAIFMGFSNGAIRRMSFNVLDESGQEARFGINQLDIGIRTTVPEPGTLLLLSAGVLGIAYARRRR